VWADSLKAVEWERFESTGFKDKELVTVGCKTSFRRTLLQAGDPMADGSFFLLPCPFFFLFDSTAS
jgi:hypothetical protein